MLKTSCWLYQSRLVIASVPSKLCFNISALKRPASPTETIIDDLAGAWLLLGWCISDCSSPNIASQVLPSGSIEMITACIVTSGVDHISYRFEQATPETYVVLTLTSGLFRQDIWNNDCGGGVLKLKTWIRNSTWTFDTISSHNRYQRSWTSRNERQLFWVC